MTNAKNDLEVNDDSGLVDIDVEEFSNEDASPRLDDDEKDTRSGKMGQRRLCAFGMMILVLTLVALAVIVILGVSSSEDPSMQEDHDLSPRPPDFESESKAFACLEESGTSLDFLTGAALGNGEENLDSRTLDAFECFENQGLDPSIFGSLTNASASEINGNTTLEEMMEGGGGGRHRGLSVGFKYRRYSATHTRSYSRTFTGHSGVCNDCGSYTDRCNRVVYNGERDASEWFNDNYQIANIGYPQYQSNWICKWVKHDRVSGGRCQRSCSSYCCGSGGCGYNCGSCRTIGCNARCEMEMTCQEWIHLKWGL